MTVEILNIIISLCSIRPGIPATFAQVEKWQNICIQSYFSCIENKSMVQYNGLLECIKERKPSEEQYRQ